MAREAVGSRDGPRVVQGDGAGVRPDNLRRGGPRQGRRGDPVRHTRRRAGPAQLQGVLSDRQGGRGDCHDHLQEVRVLEGVPPQPGEARILKDQLCH